MGGRANEQGASLAPQFDDIVAAAEMSNIDDEHDPEDAMIAFERARVSALHGQAVRDAAALRRTLADLDDEEFGACEQCGCPIGFERRSVVARAKLVRWKSQEWPKVTASSGYV